ncbi:MAG: hypothetical protein ACLSAF_06490 [Intestinimonas sp.]
MGLNDLSVSLVPLGSGPDIQSFLEADIRIPHTSVSYDSGADALVLRLENTVLETGDPAEAAGNDDWVFDFIGEHGLRYPYSFPMGSIGEDNRFFERAAISTDGTDTTITLRLTGKAMSYRVESGSLDGEGMLPISASSSAKSLPELQTRARSLSARRLSVFSVFSPSRRPGTSGWRCRCPRR